MQFGNTTLMKNHHGNFYFYVEKELIDFHHDGKIIKLQLKIIIQLHLIEGKISGTISINE